MIILLTVGYACCTNALQLNSVFNIIEANSSRTVASFNLGQLILGIALNFIANCVPNCDIPFGTKNGICFDQAKVDLLLVR